MRIYFSAAVPCVLRVGGAPAGFLSGNELCADVDEHIPAEFIPIDANLLPLAFVAGESFFHKPPACCDVYRCGCYNMIHAARFIPRQAGFDAKCQGRGADMQATVFECGGPFLCIQDSTGFDTFPLPQCGNYEIGEEQIGNERFLCVHDPVSEYLGFFSSGRKRALQLKARAFECGERLLVTQAFADIACHTVQTEYGAENGELILRSKKVSAREGFDPKKLNPKILPFAFFQEIAAGGDFTAYLAPALAEKAELLQEYLGDFCAAAIPKEMFYRVHGTINGVGLVCRRAENIFDVRFFRAETENGLITNILPVE